MTAAYILIQMNAKDPRKVMATIRAIAGVKQAHLLVGLTDCIAYVEADTLESLGDTVVALRSVDGVVNTDTRIAVPVQ
jgi:nitrate reductase NapAB chaperone NapD